MKKIINIMFVALCMLPIFAFTQTKGVSGTYLCSDEQEYLQIDKNNYKIIRTQLCTPCMDLDEGDSIASYGRVEFIQDGFIKLQSDIDSAIYQNATVKESHDESIKDSVKIRFVFPFKGKFRIGATLLPYLFTESNCITTPRNTCTLDPLIFDIYKQNLKYNGNHGEYFGRIAFCNFQYQIKDKNTNSLLITIPNLTNSYFARYFINGEYAKVEKNKIIWRNREYKKISDDLITPEVDLGILQNDIDNPNGVDWADELLELIKKH